MCQCAVLQNSCQEMKRGIFQHYRSNTKHSLYKLHLWSRELSDRMQSRYLKKKKKDIFIKHSYKLLLHITHQFICDMDVTSHEFLGHFSSAQTLAENTNTKRIDIFLFLLIPLLVYTLETKILYLFCVYGDHKITTNPL